MLPTYLPTYLPHNVMTGGYRYHPLTFGLGLDRLTFLPRNVAALALEYRVDGLLVSSYEYTVRFRYPKEQWIANHTYAVKLTATPGVTAAVASSGSGLYYFSALHKGLDLPGAIVIGGSTASATVPAAQQVRHSDSLDFDRTLRLYPPRAHQVAFDVACGTAGMSEFAPGGSRCNGVAVMMCGEGGRSPR